MRIKISQSSVVKAGLRTKIAMSVPAPIMPTVTIKFFKTNPMRHPKTWNGVIEELVRKQLQQRSLNSR
jgi:hypothetical protein